MTEGRQEFGSERADTLSRASFTHLGSMQLPACAESRELLPNFCLQRDRRGSDRRFCNRSVALYCLRTQLGALFGQMARRTAEHAQALIKPMLALL